MLNKDISQFKIISEHEIKSAGFVMFWRNDERIDTLPLDTQGFYFQLVRLVCHEDGAKSYDGKLLLTGQYGTSLARISDRFGLSIRQVRTHFKRLSDAKIITSKSDTRKTIVTICNYKTFHQNSKGDRHTKRQANDTPNDKPTTHIEEEFKEFKEFKESNYITQKETAHDKSFANPIGSDFDSDFNLDSYLNSDSDFNSNLLNLTFKNKEKKSQEKKITEKKTPREQAEEKGFLELWEAGKNKNNRQSAERRFLETIKEVSLEILISQRKAYNLDMEAKFKGRDVNYQSIDVWLNKRRWEDEYTSSHKQSPSSLESSKPKQKFKYER